MEAINAPHHKEVVVVRIYYVFCDHNLFFLSQLRQSALQQNLANLLKMPVCTKTTQLSGIGLCYLNAGCRMFHDIPEIKRNMFFNVKVVSLVPQK